MRWDRRDIPLKAMIESTLLENIRRHDKNQVELFTSLPRESFPQSHERFNDPWSMHHASPRTQRRERESLTSAFKSRPIFPCHEPGAPGRLTKDFDPQAGCASPCPVQGNPFPVGHSFRITSLDSYRRDGGLSAGDGKVSYKHHANENEPSPERCSLGKVRKRSNTSSIHLAEPSWKRIKRSSSLATRNERKAAQNAAHTAMEQQRRSRISKAIEAIAKLMGIGVRPKVDILEGAVEWIGRIIEATMNIASRIGLEGSDPVRVLESVANRVGQAILEEAGVEGRAAHLTVGREESTNETLFTILWSDRSDRPSLSSPMIATSGTGASSFSYPPDSPRGQAHSDLHQLQLKMTAADSCGDTSTPKTSLQQSMAIIQEESLSTFATESIESGTKVASPPEGVWKPEQQNDNPDIKR